MSKYKILNKGEIENLNNAPVRCFKYQTINSKNDKYVYFIFGISLIGNQNISDSDFYPLADEALKEFEKEDKKESTNGICYFELKRQRFDFINGIPNWAREPSF